MIALGKILFNMPFRGSFMLFMILFFVFAFTITMFAILLSTFCQTQQQAVLAIMTFLFISLMLSGGMGAVQGILHTGRAHRTRYPAQAGDISAEGVRVGFLSYGPANQ